MNSHAQVPTALVLPDRIRVYFASRPEPGLSMASYVDLDPVRPTRILGVAQKPILDLGRPGSFDEYGVHPAAVIAEGDYVRLYYTGWCRLSSRARYHNATGLAISEDGGCTFRRAAEGPILDRTPAEPFSATAPAVINLGDVWHMIYSSGLGWIEVDGKLEHVYDLRHAISADGIHWQRNGNVALGQTNAEEALTRPTLLQHDSAEWWMWYSYRGSRAFRGGTGSYRIGFARSADLTAWHREDQNAGIGPSNEGWDSEMVAYPCVVKTESALLMFYNGNGFGETGFGYAMMTEDNPAGR